MIIRTVLLASFLCPLSVAALGQCQPNQWCKVFGAAQNFGPGLKDDGWHRIFFASDPNNPGIGRFYIEAAGNVTLGTSNQQSSIISPWSNSLFSAPSLKDASGQPAVASAPPWTEVSDCGDVSSSYAPMSLPQHLFLKGAISDTATSATFCVGFPTSGCTVSSGFTLTPTGSIWVDDEVIDYSSVDCNDSSGHCSTSGATEITFNFAVNSRGQRQLAGWTPPTSHNSNAYAGLACPQTAYGPRLNGTLTTDAPSSRHPVGGATYDSKRGRIWKAWGFEEIWSFQDNWYLCIFQTAYCSATQIANGWFHVNLSGNTGGPFPSPGGKNPEGYSENDQIYVPDFDVLYEFGGLKAGATDDAWIFCLSTDASQVAACHSDQNPANAASFVMNQWLPVCNTQGCQGTLGSPGHGKPGIRDGGRMVYDPVHKKVLIFGGRTIQQPSSTNPATYWTSVVQWDPLTNNYCLSDTNQASTQFTEFSGKDCGLPSLTGTPPVASGLSYFPDWAWDSKRNLAVVMQDALYTYDPGLNKWAQVGVLGGPTPPTWQNTKSMAYDSIHDMYVAVTDSTSTGFEMWELPGSALNAAGNVTPGFLLSTTPVSRTISAGQTATYTITVTPENGSFNQVVTLACSAGLPSGASCSFSPNAVTAGSSSVSSTLTITLDASTPKGSYAVTVTGTAGSVQHQTSVSLIAGQPSFSLSATPASATVPHGQSAVYTITAMAQNGFRGSVSLACSAGLPSGAACSFSPAAVTPGTNAVSSTLTISTSTGTASLARPVPWRPLLPVYALWLSLPGMALVGCAGKNHGLRPGKRLYVVAVLVMLLLLLGSCGGGSTSAPAGSSAGGGNPAGSSGSGGTTASTGTYTITIIGTSGSIQQSTTTTLVVQ